MRSIKLICGEEGSERAVPQSGIEAPANAADSLFLFSDYLQI
jgi:hypothetical protein